MTPKSTRTSSEVTPPISPCPGKPDPERPVPGRVQVHSEDDREGYSGHRPGPVHEVGSLSSPAGPLSQG